MNEKSIIMETGYSVRTPRVETRISESGHMLTIKVMRGRKELFIIRSEVNEVFNIEVILNSLELASGTRKLNKVQWSKNDIIFQRLMNVQTFRDYYEKNPRNLQIVLFEPVKILVEQDERRKAMLNAHIDGSKHYGLKKTAAILQSSYYWKNVTKDITRFIRECEHCSEKLNIFEENIDELDE